MRNIYRSKLKKRDAPGSLFFFMLTSEENTTEGENISLQMEMKVGRDMLQILRPSCPLALLHAYK
jgi:hypothetical protein